MAGSNWFQICHSYWSLAREGKVPRIVCPECELPLFISWTTSHNDPVFACLQCNTKSTPGLGVLSDIKTTVETILGRKI